MRELTYASNDAFFVELDAAVERGDAVSVLFEGTELPSDSRLLKRLRRCSNWDEFKSEAEGVGLLPPVLIFALAAMVFAAVMYSIYNNFSVNIEADVPEKKFRMILRPTKKTR